MAGKEGGVVGEGVEPGTVAGAAEAPALMGVQEAAGG